jgi:hypothetical protein
MLVMVVIVHGHPCEVGFDRSIITCTEFSVIPDFAPVHVDPAEVAQLVYRGSHVDWALITAAFPNLSSVSCLLIDVSCSADTVPQIDTDCVCAPIRFSVPQTVTDTSAIPSQSPAESTPKPTSRTKAAVIKVLEEVNKLLTSTASPNTAAAVVNADECPAVYNNGVVKLLEDAPSFGCIKTFFGGDESFGGWSFVLATAVLSYLHSGYRCSWNMIRLIIVVRHPALLLACIGSVHLILLFSHSVDNSENSR